MLDQRRIVVLHAHPYPRRSRAGRALLEAVRDLPGLSVRSLYDRYPDFTIDVGAEQDALRASDIVVWQCPFYWYGVPSLLQLWFEKVLEHGFAYGPGTNALARKTVLWVTTTGTPESAYGPNGKHEYPFDVFSRSVEQTARFCGMTWAPPIVVHGSNAITDSELAEHATTYRARLVALARRSKSISLEAARE